MTIKYEFECRRYVVVRRAKAIARSWEMPFLRVGASRFMSHEDDTHFSSYCYTLLSTVKYYCLHRVRLKREKNNKKSKKYYTGRSKKPHPVQKLHVPITERAKNVIIVYIVINILCIKSAAFSRYYFSGEHSV